VADVTRRTAIAREQLNAVMRLLSQEACVPVNQARLDSCNLNSIGPLPIMHRAENGQSAYGPIQAIRTS